jgi:hypothetical protein
MQLADEAGQKMRQRQRRDDRHQTEDEFKGTQACPAGPDFVLDDMHGGSIARCRY